MRRLSLITKITIWYTLFLIIICAALMAVVIRFYELAERNTAERRLIQVVENASDRISHAGEDFMLDDHISYYTNDTYISVYDQDGLLITGRRPRGFDEFPAIDPEETAITTDEVGNLWYIYDTTAVMKDSSDVLIRGMMNNNAYERADVFLLKFYKYTIPFLLLLAAGCGWFITRRGFAPLRGMIKITNEIRQNGNLSARVPIPSSRDEMRDLAESFNGMFDRIEELVGREKQFTSDVSHELRTPLSVIRLQSEYAMEDPDYAPEAVAVINRESRRMGDLVSKLLTLARSDVGRLEVEYETVDIAALLADIIDGSRSRAGDNGTVIEFINETDSPVYAVTDPDLLIRIMLNLIDNAIKYGKSENGRIEVRLKTVSNNSYGADYDVTAVSITVADDGDGIDPHVRDQIWQRFYRSDRARRDDGSSGLGLAMVESLTTAIGGNIRYVDEADRSDEDLGGAMIEIKIPLVHDRQMKDNGSYE